MNVNEIVNRVVFSVKKEWSTLEKIRFVYLETGKYLVKDTDFFFSMDGKLDDYNLSLEELADIYNNENPLESNKVIGVAINPSYIIQINKKQKCINNIIIIT